MRRLWIIVPLFLGACLDDFEPGSVIDDTRVLGARVEVVGADPEAASARPGDRVRVRWFVVSPDAGPTLNSVFLTCPAASARFGIEFCDVEPALASPCDGVSEPCLEVTVPNLAPPFNLLVLGGICNGGTPSIDPEEQVFLCDGEGSEGSAVTFEIPVLDPGEPRNLHPRFAGALLEGEPWPQAPPAALSGTTCPADPAVPEVSLSLPALSVQVDPASFEAHAGPEGEALEEIVQVSHFSTAGELDNQFVFLERPDPASRVMWATSGEAGALVRFHFVLRDGRGGQAWATHALCVR